jgi:hypothetical protein
MVDRLFGALIISLALLTTALVSRIYDFCDMYRTDSFDRHYAID